MKLPQMPGQFGILVNRPALSRLLHPRLAAVVALDLAKQKDGRDPIRAAAFTRSTM
jgi:hypothetical protein